jgi:hypothetical protein
VGCAFEVNAERNRAFGVARLFKDVNPALLEAGKGFDIVVSIGKPDLGAYRRAGVESDAVIGVREVFGHEPPGNRVVFHSFLTSSWMDWMRGSLGSAGKGYGLEWKGSVGSTLIRSSLR